MIVALYEAEASIIGYSIVKNNADTDVLILGLRKWLLPDLPDESVVIIDNTAFNKSKKNKRHIIEFLSLYSRDFNLIEPKSAQGKSIHK